jgi:hypothetical protein
MLPGAYDSDESRAAFATLLLELEAAPHQPQASEPASLSMAEVLLAYLDHAARHYRGPDGRPTSEYRECKLVARTLRELYADRPAAQFGPLLLKATRQAWVIAGLSRPEVNRRTNLAKGDETIDVVICFQCKGYEAYRGGKPIIGVGSDIAPDPEPLFDKILTDAGVPLAKKAHE